MHLFILEQRPQKQIHFNHTLSCLFASHIWAVKLNVLCILNLYGLWWQWCLCAFQAESFQVDEENQANTLVSVAPLPQEPLDKPATNGESPPENGTNAAPTTNGHSATQTPVADTEMWIMTPLTACSAHHPPGHTTHNPLCCLRDCPHTETNSTWIHQIHSPPLFLCCTAWDDDNNSNDEVHDYKDNTVNACNVKSLGSRGAYRRCVWDWDCSAGHWLVSCPNFSLVVTIIVESKNNAKYVLLIPDKETANALLFQTTIVMQWNQWSQAIESRSAFVLFWTDAHYLLFFLFHICLFSQPFHLP